MRSTQLVWTTSHTLLIRPLLGQSADSAALMLLIRAFGLYPLNSGALLPLTALSQQHLSPSTSALTHYIRFLAYIRLRIPPPAYCVRFSAYICSTYTPPTNCIQFFASIRPLPTLSLYIQRKLPLAQPCCDRGSLLVSVTIFHWMLYWICSSSRPSLLYISVQ